MLLSVLYLAAFLGFGLWCSLVLVKKRLLPEEFIFISGLTASLLFSYLLFYIYLVSPWFGRQVVFVFIAISAFLVTRVVGSVKTNKSIRKTVINFFVAPLALTVAVLAAYCALFYSCQQTPAKFGGYKEVRNDTYCYISHLPFDNSLPFIYGENVLNNDDEKRARSWHLVDRPPLQIGATLPVIDFAKNESRFSQYTAYHIFSMFLQLSWVGVVWGVFKKLRFSSRSALLAIFGFTVTGFFYLNSVFVWPKLLAASLVVFALFLLIDGKRLKERARHYPIAALALSLGILSHSGVVFTVVPLLFYTGFMFMRERKWQKHIKYPLAATLIGLSLLVPWQQYKSSIVESDRLIKWHLAGIETPRDKRGTAHTIIEEYRKTDFGQWKDSKGENLKTLVEGYADDYENCVANLGVLRGTCTAQKWRALTFFSTFFAFELFVLALFLFPSRAIQKKLDRTDVVVAGIFAASLFIWSFVMFLPGSNIVHQGSYAAMLLGFILGAKLILDYSPKLFAAVTTSQAVIFTFIWILAV